MTGDVGEKGEQVKTVCFPAVLLHSSFINNTYVCRERPFSEAKEKYGDICFLNSRLDAFSSLHYLALIYLPR